MPGSREVRRVAVVGAGCSGLTAVKACVEEGVVPVCLEKTGDVGGLWNYSDRPPAPHTAGIYASLVINTCKEMMAFSDFPVPDAFPQFLTHANVLRYFRRYAAHFDLLRHVRFNTEVRRVRKADDYEATGRWVVTYVTHGSEKCVTKCVTKCVPSTDANDPAESSNSSTRAGKFQTSGGSSRGSHSSRNPPYSQDHHRPHFNQGKNDLSKPEAEGNDDVITGGVACREVSEVFDGVMICTGHHTVPYIPRLPGMQQFQGQIIHSQNYKRPEPFADRSVLVIGIGNSAVDIASDLCKTTRKVYLSTRRGSWIVARTAMWGIPADMVANSRVMFNLPQRLLEYCVERQANMRMDHDKLGLSPRHRLLSAHPTINDEIPFHLMNGRIEVRPHVENILTRHVQFEDGSVEEVDAIIMATGYDYKLDFVDQEAVKIEANRVRLYKYVFPPHLPHATLAVIGLVQAIGAVMPISELQSRWFVNLLIGRCQLPDREMMEADVEKKERAMGGKYYTSRRHTLQTFWIEYMDEVAEQFGARPRLWSLFLQDPGLALRCYFGPCLPAQYRLQGPRPWPHAPTFIKDVWSRSAKRSPQLRNPDNRGDRTEARSCGASGRGERGSDLRGTSGDASGEAGRSEGGEAEEQTVGANGSVTSDDSDSRVLDERSASCPSESYPPSLDAAARNQKDRSASWLWWGWLGEGAAYDKCVVVVVVCFLLWLAGFALSSRREEMSVLL